MARDAEASVLHYWSFVYWTAFVQSLHFVGKEPLGFAFDIFVFLGVGGLEIIKPVARV